MAPYVPLPTSKKSLLPNSQLAGPIDPSELASLTIRVRSVSNVDGTPAQDWALLMVRRF